MNKEDLREVRRQLRSHYDMLKVRVHELEEERPMFKAIFDPLNLFLGISPYYYVFDRYELTAPHALRDALIFCEAELKRWSNKPENDKRLNTDQHSDIEETE